MSSKKCDLGDVAEAESGNAIDPLEVHDKGYGTVDIRKGIPQGLVHVPGRRLTVTARAAGIDHKKALVGWDDWRGYPRPTFNGVVVRPEDVPAMEAAIERRNARRNARRRRA